MKSATRKSLAGIGIVFDFDPFHVPDTVYRQLSSFNFSKSPLWKILHRQLTSNLPIHPVNPIHPPTVEETGRHEMLID